MPRTQTEPRYYKSRNAYYVIVKGKQVLLARGPKDDPDVIRLAKERFREIVPAKPIAVAAITNEEAVAVRQGAPESLKRVFLILEHSGWLPSDVCRIEVEDVFPDRKHVMLGKTWKDKKIVCCNGLANFLFYRAINNRLTGPVYFNLRGKAWTVDSLNRAFTRIRNRLGLRKELTLFSFRHGFAVKFLTNGGTVADLAKALDISVTQVRRLYLPFLQ